MYVLDKLKIVNIDKDTPRCVLIDIVESYGYTASESSVEDMIEVIRNEPPIYCSEEDLDITFLKKLARYVNKKTSWETNSLKKAYKHLHSFNPLHFSDSKDIVGPKTKENPNNIDTILVYKYCLDFHVQLNVNTTLEEMIAAMNISPATYENISRAHILYKKPEHLLYIYPLNESLAVYCAAYTKHIDISSAADIKKEFYSLKNCKDIQLWEPLDEEFRDRYNYNPRFYHILMFWNPKFNALYSDHDINTFVYKEGYNQDSQHMERSDLEVLLQTSRVTPTFYPGKLISSGKRTGIYFEHLKNIANNDCVTYGIYSCDDSSSTTTYTFQELTDHFRYSNKFSNPKNVFDIFSDVSIAKLKLILNDSCSSNAAELLSVINNIEETYNNCTSEEFKFLEKYNNCELMIFALNKVLELGMYMRGWRKESEDEPFPLSNKQANFNSNLYHKVEENVVQKSIEFTEFLEDNPDIKEDVENLPLITYGEGKNNSFSRSTKPEQGLTLKERLDIVAKGESDEDAYSCIRMSSNWIVATGYYYLKLLGKKPSFDIADMRYIT